MAPRRHSLTVSPSQQSADYFNPDNQPEPSAETGLGTHFNDTYDPALKQDHLTTRPMAAPNAGAPKEAANQKLTATNSTMTTAQLQKAAVEGDPNGLTNGLMPPNGETEYDESAEV
jgi:hypothetical protein